MWLNDVVLSMTAASCNNENGFNYQRFVEVVYRNELSGELLESFVHLILRSIANKDKCHFNKLY